MGKVTDNLACYYWLGTRALSPQCGILRHLLPELPALGEKIPITPFIYHKKKLENWHAAKQITSLEQ